REQPKTTRTPHPPPQPPDPPPPPAAAPPAAQLQQLDPSRLSPSEVIRWLEITISTERQV
ncbi:hypothetical protein ACWD3C_33310, partial [Streptomyces sp. NPDC002845]